MALTKEEVRNALRDSILAEYADVPPAEEIDHVFSDRFLTFMAALIEEEKCGSWRLLSRKSRRVLVVAAILAVSMLLVACTPTWREAVSELIVSIYERFADYRAGTDAHEEIETIYALDPVPEGFEFVSQTQHSPYYVETVYSDKYGIELVIAQAASANLGGIVDNENGETVIIPGTEISVLIYSSETSSKAYWVYNGYYMKLSYSGQLTDLEMTALITSISPTK